MKADKSHQKKYDVEFGDFLIDATKDELNEFLEETGEDFDCLAKLGEESINKALKEAENQSSLDELHECLGTLINMLRRRDKLSIDDLSKKACIDPLELHQIETDSMFEPNPRTIIQLEKFFELEPRSLVILSGVVNIQPQLLDEAVRFAAKAKNTSGLSKDEIKLLNHFVKILRDYTD